MLPSPKKCASPGGTHQASPLACCIGPGGQNLARACPGASLCGFCSCLPVPANLLHLGLGLSRFQPPGHFGGFLPTLANWHALAVSRLAPKLDGPQSRRHLPLPPPKTNPHSQTCHRAGPVFAIPHWGAVERFHTFAALAQARCGTSVEQVCGTSPPPSRCGKRRLRCKCCGNA